MATTEGRRSRNSNGVEGDDDDVVYIRTVRPGRAPGGERGAVVDRQNGEFASVYAFRSFR